MGLASILLLTLLCMTAALASILKGLAKHRAGDLQAAAVLYNAVLSAEPDNSDALNLLGLVLLAKAEALAEPSHREPLLAQAEQHIWNAVTRIKDGDPHRNMVLCNLGVVLRAKQNLAAAGATFREVMAAADPGSEAAAVSRYNLALVLLDQDLRDRDTGAAPADNGASSPRRSPLEVEAEELLREAIAHRSDYLPAVRQLALLLKHAGGFEAALGVSLSGLLVSPSDDMLLLEAAVNHHRLGHLSEARSLYEQLLRQDPGNSQAAINLAAALQTGGDVESAVVIYERLVAEAEGKGHGSSVALLNNLGAALVALGRHDEGYARLHECLRQDPDNVEALLNAGAYLQEEGLMEEALAAYDRADSLRPTAGYALRAALMLPPISASFEAAAAARQKMAARVAALTSRGNGWLPDPAAAAERIQFYLPYHGGNDRALQEAIARLYLSNAPQLAEVAPHLLPQPQSEVAAATGELMVASAAVASAAAAPSSSAAVAAAEVAAAGRQQQLRVGFVSKYFGDAEPHGLLLEGIVRHLPRRLFRVVLCPIAAPGKRVAPTLAAAADELVPLGLLRADALATLMASKLDILIFADVNSEPVTHFLAYARVARVQAAFWGNPVTTGNPSIDYFISGERMEPSNRTLLAAEEEEYSEQVVLLGGQGIWYDPPELPPELASASWEDVAAGRAEFRRELLRSVGLCGDGGISNNSSSNFATGSGSSGGGRSGSSGGSGDSGSGCRGEAEVIVYLCPQSLFKLHPSFDHVIAAILAAAGPSAHVVFTEGRRRRWTEAFKSRLAAALPGDAASRVIFLPRVGGGWPFLRLLAAADVILHPFPFGGSRTSAEALAVATPLVALRTRQLRGRMAAALCDTLAAPDDEESELSEFPDIEASLDISGSQGMLEVETSLPRDLLHCAVDDEAAYVARAVLFGKCAALREQVARAIHARSPRLWGRQEVVYEWARFLALAGGAAPPSLEEVGLSSMPQEEAAAVLGGAQVQQASELAANSTAGAPRQARDASLDGEGFSKTKEEPRALYQAEPSAGQRGGEEDDTGDAVAGLKALFADAYAAGDLPTAEATARAALELTPDDAGLLNDLGAALHQQWRLSEAEQCFRAAAAAAQGHAAALGNLGVVLAALGRHGEAERFYKMAMAAEDTGVGAAESPAMLNLAGLYRDSGRLEDGVAFLTASMRLPPLDAGGAVAAALALFEERPYHREAIEALERRQGWGQHGLSEHVQRLRERFPTLANELTVWLGWLGRLPDVTGLLLGMAGAEAPLAAEDEARMLPPQLRLRAGSSSGDLGLNGPSGGGVHLVIQRYRPADKRRQRELDFCLLQNLANPHIAVVHLLSEGKAKAGALDAGDPAVFGDALAALTPSPEALAYELGDNSEMRQAWEAGKLRVAALGRRMTFRDAFQYAERKLFGQVVAVANADVFFDGSLERLGSTATLDLAGKVYALRRWESHLDANATAEIGLSFVPRVDSQDAWLFRAPLPLPPEAITAAGFALGLPRCDNRLAAVLAGAGMKVTSPSLGLVLHHVDPSRECVDRRKGGMESKELGVLEEPSMAYTGRTQVAGKGSFVWLTDQWLW